MTAWVGKPETSPSQAGTEQLRHLARVLGPGRVLPGGRVEGEVTRKAPSQPQLPADVSGQCLHTTLALGDFCPQRRLEMMPPLSSALYHFYRALEKWEQKVREGF